MRRRPPALRLHACSPRAWDCHACRGTRHASTLFTRHLLSTSKQTSLGPVWRVDIPCGVGAPSAHARPAARPATPRPRRPAPPATAASPAAAAGPGRAGGTARRGRRARRRRRGRWAPAGAPSMRPAAPPAPAAARRMPAARRAGSAWQDLGVSTLTFEHAMKSAAGSAAGASRGVADARRQRAGTPWREVGPIL